MDLFSPLDNLKKKKKSSYTVTKNVSFNDKLRGLVWGMEESSSENNHAFKLNLGKYERRTTENILPRKHLNSTVAPRIMLALMLE